jgi:biopolymer transport protein ExbD
MAEPEGTPRLVTVRAAGLALNGIPVVPEALAARLAETGRPSTDPVFVQPAGDVSLQDLVAAIDGLRSAGFTSLVIVGQP